MRADHIKAIKAARAMMDKQDASPKQSPSVFDPDVPPDYASHHGHRVEYYECFICSKTSWRYVGNNSVLCYACDIRMMRL